MTKDPFFDEFKKIREMFRKAIGGDNFAFGGKSQGISIKQAGDETEIDIHGDISEEEIERLKRKYPNAEIKVNGNKIEGSGPVEVLDDEGKMEPEDSEEFGLEVEEAEEEPSPQELALKRFKEKQKEEEEDSE